MKERKEKPKIAFRRDPSLPKTFVTLAKAFGRFMRIIYMAKEIGSAKYI